MSKSPLNSELSPFGEEEQDDGRSRPAISVAQDKDRERENADLRISNKRKCGRGVVARKLKRSKLSAAVSFFDDQADEDEEDEPLRQSGEYMNEASRDAIRTQDRRRVKAGRFGVQSALDMARRFEDRAAADQLQAPLSSAAAGGGGDLVQRQSLIPSVSDPRFWMVDCSAGKEQQLVFQIMNKCISRARHGKPLGITGVTAAQSKGKIYIESYGEPAVIEAIRNVRGLFARSRRVVPIHDMTTIMTMKSLHKPLKQNDWVRMATRDQYKGDLALVVDVKESGQRCIVRCVPRLDLSVSELNPAEAKISKKAIKPQKLFRAKDLAAFGKHSTRNRFPGYDLDTFCDFYENNFYHEGFLLKEISTSMVKQCTEEDPPVYEELQWFQNCSGAIIDQIGGSVTGGGLLIGDTVEVVEGDLIGFRGKLLSLDESTVKMKLDDANTYRGGMDHVELSGSQVRKYVAVNMHVKVTDGRYANETGTVVALEQVGSEREAIILTDTTSRDIRVRSSQLRESTEVYRGEEKLAGYELYDLVVLSGGTSRNEVGVIVRVGREDFTVMNNNGIVREVRPEELRGQKKFYSNRDLAMDAKGNHVRVGDSVWVIDGRHKGKTGTIKGAYLTQLFLHSQMRVEHAGIFVARSRSCVLAGSRAPNRGPPPPPPHHRGRGSASSKGRNNRHDRLTGKSVSILAGPWKGYLGKVVGATATHVDIELHSRPKEVRVARERVRVVGDKFGSMEDQTRSVAVSEALSPSTTFDSAGLTPTHSCDMEVEASEFWHVDNPGRQ